jgi:hypothetical protein
MICAMRWIGASNSRFEAARGRFRWLTSGKVVDRPDALVSFEELHDIMGMHEIEELEQRFLTPEQLETKYGRTRKASIMPGAKPATKPTKPAAKSKQTA